MKISNKINKQNDVWSKTITDGESDKKINIDNLKMFRLLGGVNLTFEVDASHITVGSNGLYIGGGIFGGANAVALSDDDGDAIWSVTISSEDYSNIADGGNYIILNSPDNDGDWQTKELLSGQPCSDPGNYDDRTLPAITQDTTINLTFGQCCTDDSTSGHGFCPDEAPDLKYVTFVVNASDIEVGSNGLYIGGGIFGGANEILLSNNGDGNWSATVGSDQYPGGISIGGNYSIFNNPAASDDWDTKEDITGQSCADSGHYNDRILPPITEDTTINLTFGKCCTDDSDGHGLCPETSDSTAPVIELNGESTVKIILGEEYIDSGASASDDTDDDLTSSIITVNNVDTSKVGTYYVTYNVNDAAGNVAEEVTRTVIVTLDQNDDDEVNVLDIVAAFNNGNKHLIPSIVDQILGREVVLPVDNLDTLLSDIPETYTFLRNSITSVDYTKQTKYLSLGDSEFFTEFDNYDYDSLNSMFTGFYLNFSNPELNGLIIRDRIAKSFDGSVSETYRQIFDNWILERVDLGSNNHAFGHDIKKIFFTSLIGAFILDIIVNYYLEASYLDNQENDTLVDNKNYTLMEHRWDQAFGYLYGHEEEDISVARDNPSGEGNFLMKYFKKTISDYDANMGHKVYDAYKKGRHAIVSKDYDTRDQQAVIIKQNLSNVIGYQLLKFINNVKEKTEADQSIETVHSRVYGFIFCLQFTNNGNDSPYFDSDEVNGILSNIENFYNASSQDSSIVVDSVSYTHIEYLVYIYNQVESRFGISI